MLFKDCQILQIKVELYQKIRIIRIRGIFLIIKVFKWIKSKYKNSLIDKIVLNYKDKKEFTQQRFNHKKMKLLNLK